MATHKRFEIKTASIPPTPYPSNLPVNLNYEEVLDAIDVYLIDGKPHSKRICSFLKLDPLVESETRVIIEMLDSSSFVFNYTGREEIKYLAQRQHPNLLNLIGWACDKDYKRGLLVYEYLSLETLEIYITGYKRYTWFQRLVTAVGIAGGLKFLHQSPRPLVWLSPTIQNVFVDSGMNTKLYGFKILVDSLNGNESNYGTSGYAPPEYSETGGKLTTSSNVYSFGVILLVILTGRIPLDPSRPRKEKVLVDWARPLLLKGKIPNIMDPSIDGGYGEQTAAELCRIAEQCIDKKVAARPSMADVYKQLYRCLNGKDPDD